MIIGLLGMGTIGSGVVEVTEALADVRVKTILDIAVRRPDMTDKIGDILSDPEIELVVETMGGLHPAFEYAEAVIESGRHFVTANKYLVSEYGDRLSALARAKGVAFLYSAACGGGIPYLMNLQAAARVDRLEALGGILNGTTNFILDAMQSQGMDYAAALSQAQALGYAERDPSSDVDGLDTMRKLILACAVGFGLRFSSAELPARGIAQVLPRDIAYARAHGRVLRLCARAERTPGGLSACVEPTLVAGSAPESAILKNVNYAWYRGEMSGLMSYSGQGAGKLPTASNVVRDVRAIAAGHRALTDAACAAARPDNAGALRRYYLRQPLDAAFPGDWIAKRAADGDFACIETVALPVQSMHDYFSGNAAAFFAAIQD